MKRELKVTVGNIL